MEICLHRILFMGIIVKMSENKCTLNFSDFNLKYFVRPSYKTTLNRCEVFGSEGY